jgi:stage V sporulation protein S
VARAPGILQAERQKGAWYPVAEAILDEGRSARAEDGERLVEILKVSAQSRPKSVAGALAAVLREKGEAEIQAVGAGAVNQAVKAIAIARGFVAQNGIDLVAVPAFHEIAIGGEERTAIKFILGSR